MEDCRRNIVGEYIEREKKTWGKKSEKERTQRHRGVEETFSKFPSDFLAFSLFFSLLHSRVVRGESKKGERERERE